MRRGGDQPLPRGRGGVRDTFMTPENGEHIPTGITIDGAVYPLEGQPPVARTHGWGNLSWLRWRQQTGIRVIGGRDVGERGAVSHGPPVSRHHPLTTRLSGGPHGRVTHPRRPWGHMGPPGSGCGEAVGQFDGGRPVTE